MTPHFVRWEQAISRDLFRGEKPDTYYAEFMVDGLQRGDITSRYRAYAIGRQWGWLSVNDIRAKENEDPIDGGDIYLQPLNMIEASEAMDYLMQKNGNADQPGTKNVLDDNSNPTLKNSLTMHLAANPALLARVQHMIEEKSRSEDGPKVVETRSESGQEQGNNQGKTNENGVITPESYLVLVRNSANSLFLEIFQRALRKESQAIETARRKGKTSEDVEALLNEFYSSHRSFVRELLKAATRSYMDQVRMVGTVVGQEVRADSEVDDAVNQVLDVILERYYSDYRNCGEKLEENATQLSDILIKQVELSGLKGRV